ncbi:hypothetical protein ScPMuIL_012230 [Solemya velum]
MLNDYDEVLPLCHPSQDKTYYRLSAVLHLFPSMRHRYCPEYRPDYQVASLTTFGGSIVIKFLVSLPHHSVANNLLWSRVLNNFTLIGKETCNRLHHPAIHPRPKHFEEFSAEHPEYLEAQKVKNEHLLQNLKHMHVESHDPVQEKQMTESAKRPLPENRDRVTESEFGFQEPSFVPVGKASIKQVMDFIAQHQGQPEAYTAQDIASEYKLELVQVQQVLRYFQGYQMYLPKELVKKHPKILDSMKKKELLNPNEVKKFLGSYNPVDEGKS